MQDDFEQREDIQAAIEEEMRRIEATSFGDFEIEVVEPGEYIARESTSGGEWHFTSLDELEAIVEEFVDGCDWKIAFLPDASDGVRDRGVKTLKRHVRELVLENAKFRFAQALFENGEWVEPYENIELPASKGPPGVNSLFCKAVKDSIREASLRPVSSDPEETPETEQEWKKRILASHDHDPTFKKVLEEVLRRLQYTHHWPREWA